MNTSLAPKHTIAQTCRMYVVSSPEIKMNDRDIMITSDSDLWIFHLGILHNLSTLIGSISEEHLPLTGQKIRAYNGDCCGNTNKPKNKKKKYLI